MTGSGRLDQLTRLAQIRSDAELKRFSAFRAHVDSLEGQRNAQREKLAAEYDRRSAFSLAEARLASQQAGRLALQTLRIEAELARLRPGFEAARQQALKEFGRVQVLKEIAEISRKEGLARQRS